MRDRKVGATNDAKDITKKSKRTRTKIKIFKFM
jgi:hypothetical protein